MAVREAAGAEASAPATHEPASRQERQQEKAHLEQLLKQLEAPGAPSDTSRPASPLASPEAARVDALRCPIRAACTAPPSNPVAVAITHALALALTQV